MDKKRKILVVGDCIIDENWLLIEHHSEISSHVGFHHYRIGNKQGECIRDICGGGHVLRILNYLYSENGPEEIEMKNIISIGLKNWN